MSNKASGISIVEAVLEIILIPALFIMPMATVREVFLFFVRPEAPAPKLGLYSILITLCFYAAVFLPVILKDFLEKKKSVVAPLSIFAIQSAGFSIIYYIFYTWKPYDYATKMNDPGKIAQFWMVFGVLYVIATAATLILGLNPLVAVRDEKRPLSRLILMFIIESMAFSLYYVIFRSFESFRLPQQAMMQISVAFVFLLMAISSALKGRVELRKNAFNAPIFLMTALSILSFALSPNRYVSMKEFTQYFFVIMNFYLIVHALDAKKHLSVLSAAVIAIIALEALIGVAQHFGLNEKIQLANNFDPFSTLGNKNYVAELLAMGIPFAMGASVAARKLWHKFLIWIGIEMMLMVVLVAVTRGSWIGVIASSIVFILFAIDRLPRAKAMEAVGSMALLIVSALVLMYMSTNAILLRYPDVSYSSRFMSIINILGDVASRKPVFWAGYGLVFAAFSAALWFVLRRPKARVVSVAFLALFMACVGAMISQRQQTAVTQKLESTIEVKQSDLAPPSRVEDSITSRRFIWGGTMEMIKKYPLGVGLGAFKIRYLTMLKVYLDKSGIVGIPGFFKDVNAKEAHSEYLHIWAEMGPLALVVFAFLAWSIFAMFRKTYYGSDDPMIQALALGAFSGLVSIAASASLGFPYHIVGTSLLCGALMAVIVFCYDITVGTGVLEMGLKGFKNLWEPAAKKPVPEQQKGKKKKGAERQAEAVPEQPVVDWKNHWIVISAPAVATPAIVIVSLFFFAVVTNASYRWERSNIDMKTANFLAKAGRIQEAQNFYDMSLKDDPYNGDIHLFLGMFYQNQKRLEEALKEFEIAQTYYDLPQLSLDVGAVYFEMGEEYFDKAEKAFVESLSVYPNYPLPRYNLGLIYYQKAVVMMEKTPQQLSEKGLTPAQAAEESEKNLIKSTKMFENALQIDPTLHTASFKLALTYEKLFDINPNKYSVETPIWWYNHTLKLNPQHADANYNLGLIITRKASLMNSQADAHLRQGDKQGASEIYASATKLMGASGPYFERAIAINPQHFKALNNRGNQLFAEGKTKEALDMYRRALEVQPDYQNAKLNLALALVNLNMCGEALPHLDQLLTQAMPPRYEMKVVFMKGSCLATTGKIAEAAAVLDSEIKRMENTPDRISVEYASVVLKYAQVLDAMKRFPESLAAIQRIVSYELPLYQAAEVVFRHAVELQRTGRMAEADREFKRLKATYPNSPFARQVRGGPSS